MDSTNRSNSLNSPLQNTFNSDQTSQIQGLNIQTPNSLESALNVLKSSLEINEVKPLSSYQSSVIPSNMLRPNVTITSASEKQILFLKNLFSVGLRQADSVVSLAATEKPSFKNLKNIDSDQLDSFQKFYLTSNLDNKRQIYVPESEVEKFRNEPPQFLDESGNAVEYEIILLSEDVYEELEAVIEPFIRNYILEVKMQQSQHHDSSSQVEEDHDLTPQRSLVSSQISPHALANTLDKLQIQPTLTKFFTSEGQSKQVLEQVVLANRHILDARKEQREREIEDKQQDIKQTEIKRDIRRTETKEEDIKATGKHQEQVRIDQGRR